MPKVGASSEVSACLIGSAASVVSRSFIIDLFVLFVLLRYRLGWVILMGWLHVGVGKSDNEMLEVTRRYGECVVGPDQGIPARFIV